MIDLAIFVSMFLLAMAFHWLEEKTAHHHSKRITDSTKKHGLALALAALGHPATWNSLHEFFVHIVVYSGRIIPAH